jgi:RNA polymerase sigma-70 factor (ECF subfamily)
MQQLSDKALIASYTNGNQAAFQVLFNRHKQKIYTSIYLFVRNHDKADDIFQEVFIKVIDRLKNGQYNDDGKFLPWVMRIARNYCIDDYRNNKRNGVVYNTDEKDYFRNIPSEISTGEDGMMQTQNCEQLKDLIEQLPDEQKEVVIMRHYFGLKFNEIAEETDCNLNTVLGRMRYALINLRRMIQEQELVF